MVSAAADQLVLEERIPYYAGAPAELHVLARGEHLLVDHLIPESVSETAVIRRVRGRKSVHVRALCVYAAERCHSVGLGWVYYKHLRMLRPLRSAGELRWREPYRSGPRRPDHPLHELRTELRAGRLAGYRIHTPGGLAAPTYPDEVLIADHVVSGAFGWIVLAGAARAVAWGRRMTTSLMQAWCPTCAQMALPDPAGRCVWCDTPTLAARPRRAGRPAGKWGYLSDAQVRACYAFYEQGRPVLAIARQIHERTRYANCHSCSRALYLAFRRLGLPCRERIEACVAASRVHGLAPKHGPRPGYGAYKRRVLGGQPDQPRCAGVKTQYPRRGEPCQHPAMMGSELVLLARSRARAAARGSLGQNARAPASREDGGPQQRSRTMSTPSRRGWRETVEPGLYRAHRVACPASTHRRSGRRCECPWEVQVPGARAGRFRTLTHVGTRLEARRLRDGLRAAGRPAEILPGTLTELAGEWLRARSAGMAPATLRNHERAYRLRIAPALGSLELVDLSRQRVELWLAGLLERVSRREVVEALKTLRAIARVGVEWGRLGANPARGLRLPPPPPDGHVVERVLDEHQLTLLLERGSPSPRVRTMLRAAGEAGLRKGEVTGLRWPDVDLEGRRLVIRRGIWHQAEPGRPPRALVTPTKGRRTRRVAISPDYAQALADWYALSVVEDGADALGPVWPGRAGGPMSECAPNTALARACGRTGLVDARERPLVSFHGLRHTAASVMLAHDVPLIVVSRQLGHASPHITATVYAHLLDDGQLDLAAAAFVRAEPAMGAAVGAGAS